MKKLLLVTWLCLLLVGIIILFWYNEWIYQLPTPVPEGYKVIRTGQKIQLPEELDIGNEKPVFLHFFNPDCPCSRFNIDHFKELLKQYHEQVSFAIVVMNNDKYTDEQIRSKYGTDLPVTFDTSLATACGVYSTPQAVVLTQNHYLYYRGNYNKSRYCTDKKTNYAQIALDGLLVKRATSFDRYALQAYGCELPKCTKN